MNAGRKAQNATRRTHKATEISYGERGTGLQLSGGGFIKSTLYLISALRNRQPHPLASEGEKIYQQQNFAIF